MTAQQAKAKLLAVIKELSEAGFSVGGHWDDDIVVLIQKIEPDPLMEGATFVRDENYAEITIDDVIGL